MDRQTLATRIQHLLAKTTANGCTEAEALAAAEKASELLHLYQMSLTDLEIEAEGFIESTTPHNRRIPWNAQMLLASAVHRYCDVKGWYDSTTNHRFGLRSDVEFASWLLPALLDYVWQAADVYSLEYTKTETKNFIFGCVSRIAERLDEDRKRRASGAGAGASNALVVSKRPRIEAEYLRMGGAPLGRGRAISIGTGHGYSHGQSAGNRAGFGKPVGSGQGRPARITKQ